MGNKPTKKKPGEGGEDVAIAGHVGEVVVNTTGHPASTDGAAAAPAPAAGGAGGSAAGAGGSGHGAGGPGDTPLERAAAESAGRHALKATLDDFVFLRTVGKGSFGKVVQVRKKDDGKIYAMKILKKEMVLRRKQYEHTLSERRILECIDHPFIVSLRFAFQSEHKLFMVFDFFNGGELYYYLSEGGRFTEERARFYAAEIAMALDYLHTRGIVYRDLKPENLILDSQGHIRVTDFGLSKEGVEGESITSICGTPEYLAPEILRKKPYGAPVDWWSLGTLLFEMIAGLPPFYDKNRQVMYRKILDAPLEPPPHMSPEAADLCAKMLDRDPKKRLGYNGGREIFAHPFFRGLDWDKLYRREITPPWTPTVADDTDTRNIAPEFLSEAPAVTPSPAGGKLKDETGSTPPSFKDFTFTHASIIDGQTYRVSFTDDDPEDEDADGGGGAGRRGEARHFPDVSDEPVYTNTVQRAAEVEAIRALGGALGPALGPKPAVATATVGGGGGGGGGSALAGPETAATTEAPEAPTAGTAVGASPSDASEGGLGGPVTGQVGLSAMAPSRSGSEEDA